jgi:hypothetical protein
MGPEQESSSHQAEIPRRGTLLIKDQKTGAILYELLLDVKETNLRKVAAEIRSLIGDIDGVRVKILNNKVIVDGMVLLPKEVSRWITPPIPTKTKPSPLTKPPPVPLGWN